MLSSPPGSEDFAVKTVYLLTNPKKRIDIEKNALSLAKTYDWALIEERQEAAYREVMNRRGL